MKPIKTAFATICFDDTNVNGLGVDASVELAMDMDHGNMWTRECEIKAVFQPIQNSDGDFVLENIVKTLSKTQLAKIEDVLCRKAHERADSGRVNWIGAES